MGALGTQMKTFGDNGPDALSVTLHTVLTMKDSNRVTSQTVLCAVNESATDKLQNTRTWDC